MAYYSKYYQVEVRDSIAKEFTNAKGEIDDMLAGLHEIRVRIAEKEFNLGKLEKIIKNRKSQTRVIVSN